MDPTQILASTWAVYRDQWRRLLPIAAVVYVPIAALGAGLAVAGWPGRVATGLLTTAAMFAVPGALARAVEVYRAGGQPRVTETLGSAAQRLGPLLAAGLLAAAGVLLGLLLLIVPGLVLLTWWLVLAPVIIIEGRGTLEAFGRSRELVEGHGWPVFGVVVLTTLVLLAFGAGFGLALAQTPLPGPLQTALAIGVGDTLAAPFAAVAWTLTYFALRDLERAETAAAA
jgi:hypothetical protein